MWIVSSAAWLASAGLGMLSAAPIEIQADLPFVPADKPLEGLVVTIDPGHGGSAYAEGYAGSARGVNSGAVEGDLNMLVAGALWHLLRKAGADVTITRWDDRKVTLGDTAAAEELGRRVQMAVESRSHLFVSLHHNAAPRASADGVVVLIWPTDSGGQDQPLERALEQCLREEVEKRVHFTEHFPPYTSEHPLVAGSDIPSAVIEFGFLTNADFDAWVAQRGRHRDEARGAYEGIVRMWREHRAELEALRLRLFPELTKPGPASRPQWWWTQEAVTRRESLHRTLWPFERPPQSAKEIQWLVEQYRRRVVSDLTFFYLKTAVEKDGEGWRLHATTNAPRLVKAIGTVLERLDCAPVKIEVTELPAQRLGDKRFGVVCVPMAIMRSSSNETASVDTQVLLGENVFLLDEDADGAHWLLHGADGYAGWVRRDAVLRLDEAAFAEWEQAPRATLQREYLLDDFRLPTGARLPILQDERKHVTLRLPVGVPATRGRPGAVVPVECLRMPPEVSPARSAALTATEYLTVPYLFGGRSRLGLDCSGLTGIAYASVGLALPRNARQQVQVGRLVATPWHIPPLEPGDLLFFCDDTGRISHTGLSLGGQRYIHSSPPEVQVSSLDPADPLFSQHWRDHLAVVRRPMP